MTIGRFSRLVALGALVGVPAALIAAAFLAVVHELQTRLWDSSPPWYLVVGLPVVGACIVLAARMFLPGDGGHSPIEGIGVGPTPPSHAPGIALAALGTLAFGAVLGPEAPLIALGSAVGLAMTSIVRLASQERALMGMAGSFSAVSAVFGGPLVAGMLLIEAGVGLGGALIPTLLPGLVAAAVGYLLFVGLGDRGGLDQPGLVVPDLPVYDGTHLFDLLVALAVGISAAVLVAVVRRAAHRIGGADRGRLGLPGLLLGGALAVGLIAQLADVLGAEAEDVLFSGQASIPALVGEDSAAVVILLVAAKALAFAVCLGCGFRGGPVFPAIFLGIGLAAVAVVAFDVSPTVAIVVGTAGGMTAMTGLVFASLLFGALLVGTAGLDAIPAGVLAAVAAWITTAALERRQLPFA